MATVEQHEASKRFVLEGISSVGEWIERAFETDETTWAIRFQEWVRDH